MKLILGSGVDPNQDFEIYERLTKEKPGLFIFLGNIKFSKYFNPNDHQTQNIKELQEPNFLNFLNRFPALSIWNDADFKSYASAKGYLNKTELQNEYLHFFHEYASSSRWNRNGMYHSYELKKDKIKIQVILLDTSYFRSYPLVNTWKHFQLKSSRIDRDSNLLGREQWEWLESEFLKSYDIRLIAGGLKFNDSISTEMNWNDYPFEKLKLLNLLRKHKISGCIFLSGSTSDSGISKIEEEGLPDMYEMITGPLTHLSPSEEKTQNENITQSIQPNFGLIEISEKLKEVFLKLEIHSINEKISSVRVPLNSLQVLKFRR